MAYGLKYTGSFYNHFQEQINVNIYKKDYVDAYIPINITDLNIQYNPGENIITNTCDLEIVNTGEFAAYADLFSNTDKEFYLEVKNDTFYMFKGWMIVDLIEQPLITNSILKLSFSDYLNRLKDIEADFLDTDERLLLIELFDNSLTKTGFDRPIILASSITHYLMSYTEGFLEQHKIDCEFFWQGDKRDNCFEIMDKILKSFNCFMYVYNDQYIIERYDDLQKAGTRKYDDLSDTVSAAHDPIFAIYNKQDGDFEYVDVSQVLTHNAGAATLSVTLDEKPYSNLVRRIDSAIDEITTTSPTGNDVLLRQWGVYEDISYTIIEDYREIKNGINIVGPASPNLQGIYTKARVYYNEDSPTTLNIKWKITFPDTAMPIDEPDKYYVFSVRFWLRKGDTGWMYQDSGDGNKWKTQGSMAIQTRYLFDSNYTNTYNKSFVLEFSESIELADVMNGAADFEDYTLAILPVYFGYQTYASSDVGDYVTWDTFHDQYWGDVVLSVDSEPLDNDYDCEITTDFIKKESIKLDVFDTLNKNYANGLYYEQAGDWEYKTYSWSNDDGSTFYSLVEHLIKSKTQYLAATRKLLTAKVLSQNYFKPLAFLTDDNIDGEYFITEYRVNAITCQFDLVAMEYVTDTVTINYV